MATYDLGEAHGKIDIDTTGVTSATGVMNKLSSSLGSSFGKAGSLVGKSLGVMGRGIGLATVAVGGLAVGAGTAGLKIASDMQQAQIAFTTMLGSADKADAFLHQLADFAAATPFELPDVREGAQRLVAMGFEAKQVVPILTDVGNAVAGVGGSSADVTRVTTILGQIQAKGRLQAEEMMQLNEAGVFSWQRLADEMGTSVPAAMQEVTDGAVSSSEFLTAFQASAAENFGGLMDQQSKTLSGLFSTAKDNISIALAGAAEPITDEFSKAIGPVTDTITNLIETVGPALFGVLGSVAKLAAPLIDAFAPLVKVIATFATNLAKVLTPIIKALTPVMKQLSGSIGDVLLALMPLIPPMGDLLVAVAPLLPLLIDLVVSVMKPLIPLLVIAVEFIAKIVDGFVSWMESSSTAQTVLKVLIGVFAALVIGFQVLSAVFALNPFVLIIAAIVALVIIVVRNWDTIKSFTITAWNAILNFLKSIPSLVIGFFKALPGMLFRLWLGAWKLILSAVILGAGLIFAFVKAMPGTIVGFLAKLGSLLLHVGAEALRALWGAIRDGAVAVFNFFREMPGKIVDFVKELPGKMLDAGKAVIQGFWDGLVSLWDSVVQWIQDKLNSLPGFVKSALGIGSPSKVFHDIGFQTMQGLINGLDSQRGALRGKLDDITKDISTGGRLSTTFALDHASVGRQSVQMAVDAGSGSGRRTPSMVGLRVQITDSNLDLVMEGKVVEENDAEGAFRSNLGRMMRT